MAVRWQFVEGYESNSANWSWRIVSADGTVENHSSPFDTYGMAVSDALKRGFQPRQQHWIVATRHTITHFNPGQPPLSVPVSDEKSSYRTRNPKTRTTDSGARPQSNPEKPDPTPFLSKRREQ